MDHTCKESLRIFTERAKSEQNLTFTELLSNSTANCSDNPRLAGPRSELMHVEERRYHFAVPWAFDPRALSQVWQDESDHKESGENYCARSGPRFSDHC